MRRGDGVATTSTRIFRRRSSGTLPSPPCASAHSDRFGPPYSLSMKYGVGVEVPLEDSHELRALAERFPQQAGDGDLALQALQARGVRRELEDASLTGLGMFGEPDFARRRQVEAPGQTPLIASRNRLPRLELHVGHSRGGADLQCTGTASLYPTRGTVTMSAIVVAEELPYLRNRRRQRPIHHCNARPDRLEQLSLGDDLAGVKEQLMKDFERLGLDLDQLCRGPGARARRSSNSQSANRQMWPGARSARAGRLGRIHVSGPSSAFLESSVRTHRRCVA